MLILKIVCGLAILYLLFFLGAMAFEGISRGNPSFKELCVVAGVAEAILLLLVAMFYGFVIWVL